MLERKELVKGELQKIKCDICEEEFDFLKDLNEHFTLEHKQTETHKVKIFECKICFKTLSRASSLKIHHSRIHEGEIRGNLFGDSEKEIFQCDICEKIIFSHNLS